MIAGELRGGSKPSLNDALGWIGSRVDDIYGAAVGRLEDVWIDPGTGAPRWLLVQKGGIGGHSTLIPFEDANAGAGHVWIPYERDVVADAPEVDPAAPLTQQAEAGLRRHYVMYATRSSVPARPTPAQEGREYRSQEPPPQMARDAGPPPAPVPQAAAPEQPGGPLPSGYGEGPPPLRPPPAPPRPPAPEPASGLSSHGDAPASTSFGQWPPEREQPQTAPAGTTAAAGWAASPPQPAAVSPRSTEPEAAVSNGGHAPQAGPIDHGQGEGSPQTTAEHPPEAPGVEGVDRPYRVEIQLRGGVRISGELSGLRITPVEDDQGS